MITTSDNQTVSELRRRILQPAAQLWGYLLLVALAELTTSVASAQIGQLMHMLLLAGLALHAGLAPSGPMRHFLLALMLAPLIRILSLSLPLTRFPQLAWYPIVAVPLLLAAWVIIRQLGLSRRDLGLRLGNLPLQLALGSLGLILGACEYYILTPRPQFAEPSWQAFALATLNLLIATGFSEELIFRGILQSVGRRALGRWALLYVSLLFGVLHIGYLSVLDVVFVTCVGLTFAYLAHGTGSILGVTIAHGITNSMLFLVMPHLPEDASLRILPWAPWVLASAAIVPLAALVIIIGARAQQTRPDEHLGGRIRTLRRVTGITCVELAQRAGLPARMLGEIEQGLRQPLPEELLRIAQELNLSVNDLVKPEAPGTFAVE
ncbi:MAG: CPBP family intramembrane metalloprotease [Oscillochloris sp.]|nr:CPBP family intramembrane metalloprotease [Oscillochloris sp.]